MPMQTGSSLLKKFCSDRFHGTINNFKFTELKLVMEKKKFVQKPVVINYYMFVLQVFHKLPFLPQSVSTLEVQLL